MPERGPRTRTAFQDEDGCPDPDNDRDGIPDASDKNAPTTRARRPMAARRSTSSSSSPRRRSSSSRRCSSTLTRRRSSGCPFALLNDVAQALTDNPKLTVEVQGHTDSQGDDGYNLKLSQRRAESVRVYLIKRGIGSDRMTPVGYGEGGPDHADNRRTADGRSQNRRVEFVITSK